MVSDIDLHIGKCLRRRRRILGLTQQQVGKAVGVRFQQIQKYECGANRITAAKLWELCQALEVKVSYFYDGLSSADPDPSSPHVPGHCLQRYSPTDERLQFLPL